MAESIVSVTSTASEAVLVANTPGFLFRRLREDTGVRRIADKLTAAQILAWLRERAARAPADAKDLVLQYMYLVALSMKDRREFRGDLDALDLPHLNWSSAI